MLPALYRTASQGLETLADKGYQGAGAGLLTPVKGTMPCPDDAAYNHILTALRALAERANAMLKQLKSLHHVNLHPSATTNTAATAPAIITLHRGS